METIRDMEDVLYNHPDVGLCVEVRAAINQLKEVGGIAEDTDLTLEVLGEIRQAIYSNNRNPDPINLLFGALAGKTGNPVEAALQFVEKLARERQS